MRQQLLALLPAHLSSLLQCSPVCRLLLQKKQQLVVKVLCSDT